MDLHQTEPYRNTHTRRVKSLNLFSARYNVNLWQFQNNPKMKIKLPIAPHSLAIGMLNAWGFLSLLVPNAANAFQQQAGSPQPAAAQNAAGTESKKLLRSSSHRIHNSTPLQAKCRMTVSLFGEEVVAEGRYWQMGQGSGSARMDLSISTASIDAGDSVAQQAVKMQQVCHRGFYYRLQNNGQEPDLQIADLNRISDTDNQLLFASQNAWLSMGGLSSLIDSLKTNFDFDAPVNSRLGKTEAWKLSGKWKENRLVRLLNGQIQHSVIGNGIKWQQLPPQVPHTCEILMGADDYFPLFPYRISFFRQELEGERPVKKRILKIEFFELQQNAKLSNAIFEMNFDGIRPNDLTSEMVQRVKALQNLQRAAKLKQQNSTR